MSERPVAVHSLEHIGAPDRGITLFRNQVRRGIRTMKAGEDPVDGSAVIPTCCNNTVVRVPPVPARASLQRHQSNHREPHDSDEFVKERLCLLEIGGVEAFGEPTVDGCE